MVRGNVVLIGMPSSGKSTIGPLLADKLGMEFIDTDLLIRSRQNKDLKDIVNEDGLQRFLEIQEKVVLDLSVHGYVIATGGSIIYNQAAMSHLKSMGEVIFLHLDIGEIENRLAPGRRFAKNKEQSFEDIYNERIPLYEKYADQTICCSGKAVEDIVKEITNKTKVSHIHTI